MRVLWDAWSLGSLDRRPATSVASEGIHAFHGLENRHVISRHHT